MGTEKIKSREDVLKLANANDVKFIRLQFCDIHGVVKNMSITIDQLEKALDKLQLLDNLPWEISFHYLKNH